MPVNDVCFFQHGDFSGGQYLLVDEIACHSGRYVGHLGDVFHVEHLLERVLQQVVVAEFLDSHPVGKLVVGGDFIPCRATESGQDAAEHSGVVCAEAAGI